LIKFAILVQKSGKTGVNTHKSPKNAGLAMVLTLFSHKKIGHVARFSHFSHAIPNRVIRSED